MARESDGWHYTVTGFSSAAALVDIDSSHFFLSTRRGEGGRGCPNREISQINQTCEEMEAGELI
jgi:hypothetical protein